MFSWFLRLQVHAYLSIKYPVLRPSVEKQNYDADSNDRAQHNRVTSLTKVDLLYDVVDGGILICSVRAVKEISTLTQAGH